MLPPQKIRVRIVCPECNAELGELEGDEQSGSLVWARDCEHYVWALIVDKKLMEKLRNVSLAYLKSKNSDEALYMCLPIKSMSKHNY
jgi:hypothetical protein